MLCLRVQYYVQLCVLQMSSLSSSVLSICGILKERCSKLADVLQRQTTEDRINHRLERQTEGSLEESTTSEARIRLASS